MNPFIIAASEYNVIGIIAFVAWILFQLFGNKKGGPSHQEGASPETGSPADPRDELRKFFEELEKSTTTIEEPQRPVTPPPLRQTPPREPPPRRLPETRIEARPTQVRPTYAAPDAAYTLPELPVPSTLSKSRAKPHQPSTMPELHNPVALRKFIVATEILGKPIALRQG